MSVLRPKDKGTYAFDDAEALKAFLHIDDQCLGTTLSNSRCRQPLKQELSHRIHTDFDKINAGFPSSDAAKSLKTLAEECVCESHKTRKSALAAGLYKEWSRRLWIEVLKENNLHWDDLQEPPDVGDEKDWFKKFARIRDGPPPKPLTRRSTLKERLKSRSHIIGRLAILSYRGRSNQRSLEDHDGSRRASQGSAETGRQELAAHAKPRVEDDEKPGLHAPPETDCQGLLPTKEEDEKSDAPVKQGVEVATPVKSRALTGETGNTQRLLYPPIPRSPGESPLSIAPSATFSVGSKDNETPDSTYSHDPLGVVGKGPSSVEASRPEGSRTLENSAPAPRPSPEPSKVSYGPRESTDRRGDVSARVRRMKGTIPISQSRTPEDSPGSGQSRLPDVPTEPDTPTKPRPPLARAARNSLDSEDEQLHTEQESDFKPFRAKKETEKGGTKKETKKGATKKETTKEEDTTKERDTEEEQNAERERLAPEYNALKKVLERVDVRVPPTWRGGGSIYIYQRKGASRFVKIGKTTKPFRKRLEEIGKKCKYDPMCVKEWPMDMALSVVEKCIHYRLDDVRHRDLRCQRLHETTSQGERYTCNENHTEWFKIGARQAREVVDLWKDFIGTRPFDTHGVLTQFWRNKVNLVFSKMEDWHWSRYGAFEQWDAVMREGVKEAKASNDGNPMAGRRLRLSFGVRSDGDGEVLDVFDEDQSDTRPISSTPIPSRLRKDPKVYQVGQGENRTGLLGV